MTLPSFNQRFVQIFLLATFLLMWVGTMGFILRFGTNVPYWDEWLDTVPFLTGNRDLTIQELWKPHFEHRILLPRLIEHLVLRTTGNNFQAMHLFNGVVVGLTVLILLLLVGWLRSQKQREISPESPSPRFLWSVTDAFLPVALLHLAHYSNLLWGFQIQFYGTAFLLAVLLCGIFRWDPSKDFSVRNAIIFIALPLAALPFFGSNGLVFATLLACWATAQCYLSRKNKTLSTTAQLVILFAVTIAIVMTAVFVWIPSPPAAEPTKDAVLSARIATEALFVSLGRGAILGGAVVGEQNGYPASFPLAISVVWWLFWTGIAGLLIEQYRKNRSKVIGLVVVYSALLILGGLLSGRKLGESMYLLGIMIFPILVFGVVGIFIVAITGQFIKTPGKRSQILGVAAFFLATIAIAIAIGIARALPPGIGNGLASRYSILTVFALVTIYLFATRYAKPTGILSMICPILFWQAVLFLPNNTYEGIIRGTHNREALVRFQQKIGENTTITEMTAEGLPKKTGPTAVRSGEDYLSPSDKWLSSGLTQLRDAKIKPYDQLKD